MKESKYNFPKKEIKVVRMKLNKKSTIDDMQELAVRLFEFACAEYLDKLNYLNNKIIRIEMEIKSYTYTLNDNIKHLKENKELIDLYFQRQQLLYDIFVKINRCKITNDRLIKKLKIKQGEQNDRTK